MSIAFYGAIAVALAFVAFRVLARGRDVTSWAQHAAHSGNLQLLIEHIEQSDDVATGWDQAIGTLWESYNRETAARLVVEGVQRTDAKVMQYWIKRFQEVEPEIAEAYFTDEFLASYYRPEIAAKCGRSCGCG